MTIGFDLPGADAVRLDIFNARGQRVRALGTFPAEQQQAQWDGRDERGGRCAAGVYFYRLSTARGAWTGKMVLVR